MLGPPCFRQSDRSNARGATRTVWYGWLEYPRKARCSYRYHSRAVSGLARTSWACSWLNELMPPPPPSTSPSPHPARQDAAFAVWGATPDGARLSLEALQVYIPEWQVPDDAFATQHGSSFSPSPESALARALATQHMVRLETPSEQWERAVIAAGGSVARSLQGRELIIPLLDGSVLLGVLVLLGPELPEPLLATLPSAGVLHLACADLTRRFRRLMQAHRTSRMRRETLEDLVQPLTVAVAQVETVLELCCRGETPEIPMQFEALRRSASRLRGALAGPPARALLQTDHSGITRCQQATDRLLAGTR